MPWVHYNKVARGVIVSQATLSDRMALGALQDAGLCQDVWPLGPATVFLVVRSVDTRRPVMQPNCVPPPAVDGTPHEVPDDEGERQVSAALENSHPPQHWPDDDADATVAGHIRGRWAWFARSYLVQ
jgi:hypothetical protein